jgi:hypothetical protein
MLEDTMFTSHPAQQKETAKTINGGLRRGAG